MTRNEAHFGGALGHVAEALGLAHLSRLLVFQNTSRMIMFLVAVEQPRQDHGRKVLFDGKLGCWTLTELDPCSRNRKNSPKGTMMMK